MPTRETIFGQDENQHKSNLLFWLAFCFLLLAVFAFHGKTVPYSNEFLYLLRLNPNLPNDWTFSQTANEHWLFNFLFSFPARFITLETLGWIGRFAVWSLCLAALLKLGRLWKIPFWAVAASIFLWLASAQSVINDEWIFGGFEAKTVAYVFLLFALNGFSRHNIIQPSVFLGLAFSFHPAVGLWAIPAAGLALLFEKIPSADFVKAVVLTFLFSLPGFVPLFTEQSGVQSYSFEDWQFIVTMRVPWHLDPFYFSKTGILLVFAMLFFNAAALWKSGDFALRFLLKFQIALGVFFLFGIVLRVFELYPLLRFMPMRLFPVFTPLFFLFTAFYIIPRLGHGKHEISANRSFESVRFVNFRRVVVTIFVLIAIALLSPLEKGFAQFRGTVQTWTEAPDNLQKTSLWIAENTPPGAIVIQPPHSREFWFYSKRASIVSYAYPTFNRLGEWRERIADLTGNMPVTDSEKAAEEIEEAYNRLSAEQIAELKQKYGAGYLVSRAIYPYPIIFETQTYKVYQLP